MPLLRGRARRGGDARRRARRRAARHRRDATIGAGTTLAELEVDPEIPQALREACALAASPQLRSMGTIGGNLLQATRCWYWRLKYPCFLHGGTTCHAREGAHREHAIFGNERCASAHPSDPAAALLALGATRADRPARAPLADLYRLPTEDDRDVTALEPGELILELEVPKPDGERLPEGDGPQAVHVRPRRRRGRARRRRDAARARRRRADPVAARRSPEGLDRATPLPGTAYKVDLARALVRRALDALA